MQPCQYICWQPDSPLNLPLCLSKWLPTHCKGVLSRIRLIITQQGSEKVSVGDAPMGGPASTACAGARTRELHGCVGVIMQLRLTSMWDWICMCPWSCACVRVCWQGFPWRRHSTGADPAGGKAMIYSFAAHISLSSNRSPAVFTSACTGHRLYKPLWNRQQPPRLEWKWLDLSEFILLRRLTLLSLIRLRHAADATQMSLDPSGFPSLNKSRQVQLKKVIRPGFMLWCV